MTEERSAGNPHATFCGNRRRVTASDDPVEGLIEKPPRTESGYRNYRPDVISRLSFIREAKSLGFSLMEIKELLSLKFSPETNCGDVRSQAEKKILDIEHKIDSLQRMKQALVKLVTACPGSGPTSECPILEAMETKKLG